VSEKTNLIPSHWHPWHPSAQAPIDPTLYAILMQVTEVFEREGGQAEITESVEECWTSNPPSIYSNVSAQCLPCTLRQHQNPQQLPYTLVVRRGIHRYIDGKEERNRRESIHFTKCD